MKYIGAFVLPPQVSKAAGIKRSFNLNLDTTATSTTVNTAGSNIGNTQNIKDNTTSSSQGIAAVDMLNVAPTVVSNNTVEAAGLTTTGVSTGTSTSNAGAEYSDVQQSTGVMPAAASFQFVRPPELELEKYLALNGTKMTTDSTGKYISITHVTHSSSLSRQGLFVALLLPVAFTENAFCMTVFASIVYYISVIYLQASNLLLPL
jgi:hypothetical protein